MVGWIYFAECDVKSYSLYVFIDGSYYVNKYRLLLVSVNVSKYISGNENNGCSLLGASIPKDGVCVIINDEGEIVGFWYGQEVGKIISI